MFHIKHGGENDSSSLTPGVHRDLCLLLRVFHSPSLYLTFYWKSISCSLKIEVTDRSNVANLVCTHVWACSVASVMSNSDLMDYSLPGSSVHGIFQAKILESVAMPSSGECSWPRDRTHVPWSSCTTGGFFTAEPPGKPRYGIAQVISDLFIPLTTSERITQQSTNSLRVKKISRRCTALGTSSRTKRSLLLAYCPCRMHGILHWEDCSQPGSRWKDSTQVTRECPAWPPGSSGKQNLPPARASSACGFPASRYPAPAVEPPVCYANLLWTQFVLENSRIQWYLKREVAAEIPITSYYLGK